MPRTSHFIDVDAAQVSHASDGSVVVDDPGSPWLVRLWVRVVEGRARIVRMRVDVRDRTVGITAARLGRLPTAQLLHVALSEAAHPNETFYRMLAVPKPAGQRSWDDGHWARVLQVYQWALATNRPGGGVRAVADMWGVSVNPTARRWLAEARRRAA